LTGCGQKPEGAGLKGMLAEFVQSGVPGVSVAPANLGTMHIGQRLPSASSLVFNSEFISHARSYVSAAKR